MANSIYVLTFAVLTSLGGPPAWLTGTSIAPNVGVLRTSRLNGAPVAGYELSSLLVSGIAPVGSTSASSCTPGWSIEPGSVTFHDELSVDSSIVVGTAVVGAGIVYVCE